MTRLLTIIGFSIAIITTGSCNSVNNIWGEYTIFPNLPPTIESSDDAICADHSRIYRQSLDNFTLWAYQMWDSSAKSTVGTLQGNLFHMGHFDECLAAKAPFPTQYCLVTVEAIVPHTNRSDPFTLYHDPYETLSERLYYSGDKSQWSRNRAKIAWCTPASCKPKDLQRFLNDYYKNADTPFVRQNQINFTVNLADSECQSYEDQVTFDTADVSFCVVTVILLLTVMIATFLDVNQAKENSDKIIEPSLLRKVLLIFSLRTNFRSLMKIEQYDPNIAVLHGVRVISIIGIVMGHRILFLLGSAVFNPEYLEFEYRKFQNIFLFRGDLFVDLFFVLSGILVTYNLLNQFEKRTNPAIIVFLRYIRLTPAVAFIIYFYATVYNFTGSGPLWKTIITSIRNDCRDNWWTHLLYINNYVNANDMCLAQSWYLACDFHYFLIAIGICLLITKNRQFGLFALFSIALLSIILRFVVVFVYEIPGLVLFFPEFGRAPWKDFVFRTIYITSHTRATPYFIGMITGYIYYRLKGKNRHVSKVKAYLIVAISVLMIFVSLSGSLIFYNPYYRYNKYESASYAALNRTIFALGSVAIFYVASYGHCKFIYRFLSWKLWIPMGRLTFGVYLIHMAYQFYTLATLESSLRFRYFRILTLGVTDLVVSYAVALVLYLTIEEPCKRICMELLMKRKEIVLNKEM